MAVNIKTNDAQQAQAQAQTQNQFTPKTPTTSAVFGISTRLSGYGSGGETYEKLFEQISKKLKFLNEELKTEEQYTALKLLKQNLGLNYSGIAVCEAKDGHVTAHVLIVEKTGDYPDKFVENIGGIKYEITRTPADALDDKYIQSAIKVVSETLKVDPSRVFVVDGTLVPSEFDVTNEAQVMSLLENTLRATHSEVVIRTSGYKGVNVSDIINASRNGKFVINTYFNEEGNNFFDQTGMPVRQDICVALSYKTNQNNQNRSINQGSDTFDIVKVYGYVDFEWSPIIVNNMMTTQKFLPNFIITHIDSDLAPTPDILMLGVASVLAVNEEVSWLQAFRPSHAKKGDIDINDIGALNIEGNIENNPTGFGKKYDTKSKSFTLAELYKFAQTLVRPNMIISIDVPRAGVETWFTSIFQYIKFQNNKNAWARLVEFLNTLTNGNFAIAGAPMFTDISNKMHGGYYRTKDGFKDIRHVSSYLAVANFVADTNQSPALITQYTNTLYNTSIPAELRASERKKYIDEISNRTAVYKQSYDRLTFSAAFISSLVNGLKAAGFAPVRSNIDFSSDVFQRRNTVDFSAATLDSSVRVLGQQNVFGGYYGMPYGYNRLF